MNYLFEADIWVTGKSGSFEVYELKEGKYLCKMIYWEAEQDPGPGDVVLWKTKKKWKIDKDSYPQLKIALANNINEYLYRA